MKAHGKKFLPHDEDYKDMLRYDHFCHEKLIEAGYSPQGWDREKDVICVMKLKDPKRHWDIDGRKIYYFDSYVDAAEELIGVKQADYESNEAEKKKPLHITMQMWAEAGSFDRIAKAGNSVDDEIVEQFRNALPPIYNGENLLQAGDAYSHILVEELGVYAPTYATFKRCVMPSHPDGIWVYMGNCLRGETRDCTNLMKISRKTY